MEEHQLQEPIDRDNVETPPISKVGEMMLMYPDSSIQRLSAIFSTVATSYLRT
jgi:hypothetical protein